MRLQTYFWALATVFAASLLLCGGLLYAVAVRAGQGHDDGSFRRLAEAVGAGIEQFLAVAEQSLEGLAPEAPPPAEGEARRALEGRWTRRVPGAMLVRILADSIDAPDESRVPRMGFADLDLVRTARTGKPAPQFLMFGSADAHIALARRLEGSNAVLLASLAPDAVFAVLPRQLERGALELVQDELSLRFVGEAGFRGTAPAGTVPIQRTPWTLRYWRPLPEPVGLTWFLLLPALVAAVSGFACALAFRHLNQALRQDQEVIAGAVQELLAGRVVQRVNAKVRELQTLMVQLANLKPARSDRPPRRVSSPPAGAGPAIFETPPESAAKPEEPPVESTEIAPMPFTPRTVKVNPVAEPLPEITAVEISPTLFRAYEICGIVGDTLNAKVVQLLGGAIGSEARERGQHVLALARDGRSTSPELLEALAAGLLETGCSVVDLGLAPLPVLYFAAESLKSRSGVLVSAGHGLPEANGLRILLAGERLAGDAIWSLRERIKQQGLRSGQGARRAQDFSAEYSARVVADVTLGRPLNVVIDCGNGLAGMIAPALIERLGCSVVPLFAEVDFSFPNHPPDPGDRRNLELLIHTVQERQADLGLAFDADGDRLVVIDSSGRMIRADRVLMLLAAAVLAKEPGSTVIADVYATRHLAGQVSRLRGRLQFGPGDRSRMMARMQETGALLAADRHGRFYFRDRWSGVDDAFYAAARLLEVLAAETRRSAELFAALPNSATTPDQVFSIPKAEIPKVMERALKLAEFPKGRITDVDGLRVDFADGFGLLRPRELEAAVELHIEADQAETIQRINRDFRILLKKAKPNIVFPSTSKAH